MPDQKAIPVYDEGLWHTGHTIHPCSAVARIDSTGVGNAKLIKKSPSPGVGILIGDSEELHIPVLVFLPDLFQVAGLLLTGGAPASKKIDHDHLLWPASQLYCTTVKGGEPKAWNWASFPGWLAGLVNDRIGEEPDDKKGNYARGNPSW
jgi:hypothetical protein